MDTKKKQPRYSGEFRERAVRLVEEQQKQGSSQWAAMQWISQKLGSVRFLVGVRGTSKPDTGDFPISAKKNFHFLVVLLCLGCTAGNRLGGLNAPMHSVRLEHHGERQVMVSKSWAPGLGRSISASFDRPREIARHGPFALLYSPSSSEGNCIGQFPTQDFHSMFGRFASIVQSRPFARGINLTFATVPEGRAYSQTERVPITDRMTIRLVFAASTSPEACDDWWLSLLTTYVHELTHLGRDLSGIVAPNVLSEEVIAYSAARCVQLTVRHPYMLKMTEFDGVDASGGDKAYSRLYRDLVAHLSNNKNIDDVSMRGKILADFHFYRILGYSYGLPISPEIRRELDEYCNAIGHSQLDFSKTDYFLAIKTSNVSEAPTVESQR